MDRSVASVTIAAALVASAAAVHTLGVYLPTINSPHTSLEGVAHAPVESAEPPLARRLVVIIFDGLSFEAARALPELEPLRRRGVFRSVSVAFPSFTSPALVSFMTGLEPRDSGIRRNGDQRRVAGLDTLMRAAADARVPVSVWSHGFGEFASIMAPPPDAPVHVGPLGVSVDRARRSLVGAPPPGRSIDLIHWGLLDDTGHEHGAASPEYRKVARDGAAFIARYAASLDLDRDALVVLSDHGHLARGGHGGAEDEVRHAVFLGVGAPFRRDVELAERPMRDVASTLAVVAGVRAPSSSLGLPMIDALAIDDRDAAARLAGPFAQAGRFLCALRPDPACGVLEPLAAKLRARDATARPAAEAVHASLTRARDLALDEQRHSAALRRLALAAAAIAALFGAARNTLRSATRALWLPLVHAAVYVAYLAVRGFRPGFSYLEAAPELVADTLPGVLLAAVATAILARRLRPGPLAPWILLGGTAIPFALLATWVGWDPVTPPPPIAGAAIFHLAPALIGAAVAAVLVALADRGKIGARFLPRFG